MKKLLTLIGFSLSFLFCSSACFFWNLSLLIHSQPFKDKCWKLPISNNQFPISNIQDQLKKYPSHLFLQLDHDRLAGGRHGGKSLSETLENG